MTENSTKYWCKNKSVKGKISLYYYENIFDLTDLLKGSWRLPRGPKPHFEDCWALGFSVGLDVRAEEKEKTQGWGQVS